VKGGLCCAVTEVESIVRGSREEIMANREQRANKEKKKPKRDKAEKEKGAGTPFVQPELVRKLDKGKDKR
jgi:hypothetical protein